MGFDLVCKLLECIRNVRSYHVVLSSLMMPGSGIIGMLKIDVFRSLSRSINMPRSGFERYSKCFRVYINTSILHYEIHLNLASEQHLSQVPARELHSSSLSTKRIKTNASITLSRTCKHHYSLYPPCSLLILSYIIYNHVSNGRGCFWGSFLLI